MPQLLCMLAVGCGAPNGPLLIREDAGSAGPRVGASLQYQITGQLDTRVDAEVFVTDLFDTRAEDVAALHASGRSVMAYVSVGSFEPWRPDAERFPDAAVGMHLAGYPEESWLDVRSQEVRAAMEARFELARSKGFDGVFASTLGAYAQSSGFALTPSDQLQYDRFIADAARARGLSPGLSADFELGAELLRAFDWALSVGCIARGDCDKLSGLKSMGKPVFDLETEGEAAAVCAMARSLGIPTTRKHAGFDAWREPCS